MKRDQTVHLGYEIGTGNPVEIPLAHTFVAGQTRLSGKTTALRAIVMRSGRRALAFVTKRGEEFEGRRIRPYLPREGDRPIHWRLVETIVASVLGMKHMPRERWFILNAARGAKSLQQVRDNIDRLIAKTKQQATKDQYELVGEYLDLVLPEMRELNAAQTLDLQPGLNVIDVSGHSAQLQAMVIRACLEHINRHEEQVLTVFPEAWEFAPRGRKTPASDEAVAMARKGGVLGNWLLSDSQDIAGVDTTIRQGASVWLLGVQRELNELKRTLAMIPAGIKKPKAADITSLELGQFVACWGSQAVRTYVQPTWMSHQDAHHVATGQMSVESAIPLASRRAPTEDEKDWSGDGPIKSEPPAEPVDDQASTIESEDDMSKEDIEAMQKSIGDLVTAVTSLAKTQRQAIPASAPAAQPHSGNGVDEEALYQRFKERLTEEAPALIRLLAEESEINVEIERVKIEMDKSTLSGRIAYLIANDFCKSPVTNADFRRELQRTGPKINFGNLARTINDFIRRGFITEEAEGYKAVPGMKVNIVKK